jgi:hypothetical protein
MFCGIPNTYQLIYDPSNMIPLGYEYVGKNIKVSKDLEFMKYKKKGILILRSRLYDIIPAGITELHVINIGDYINSMSEDYIRSLSKFDIENMYDSFVSIFWPFLVLSQFQKIINNEGLKIGVYNFEAEKHFYSIINEIRVADIERRMIVDVPKRVDMYTISYMDKSLNTDYIFDQFKVSNKYHSMYFKVDNNTVLWKYPVLKKIKYDLPKKTRSIKINNDIIIYDDKVIHKTDDIIKAISTIEGTDRLYKVQDYTYNFLLQLHDGEFKVLNMNKIVSSFPSMIVEQDIKNIGNVNYYAMYYKLVNLEYKEGPVQFGSYIRIKGSSMISIDVSDIKDINDLQRVYNFICRIFYLYYIRFIRPMTKSPPRKLNYIKGLLKTIDPVLYGYHKKDISGFKLYSRRVSKSKHPLVFHEDSKILKRYIKDTGAKNILRYKNFTYPGKYSIYICPNKKYKYFHLRPPYEHPNDICMVSCGVKDKSREVMYKHCISGEPFKMDQINPNIRIDQSNMYYIRQFKEDKGLLKRKLSMLPKIIHRFFNIKCNITNNILEPGSSCYLIMGSSDNRDFYETIHYAIPWVPKYIVKEDMWYEQWDVINYYYSKGVNTVIYNLDMDTGVLILKNLINYNSLLELLDSQKTIFILKLTSKTRKIIRYSIICKLRLHRRKKYELVTTFTKDDSIVSDTKDLVLKLLNDEVIDQMDFLTIHDLIKIKADFIQIRDRRTNIINMVLIRSPKISKYLSFPVTPSFLDINGEHIDSDSESEIKKYFHNNTIDRVLLMIKYLNKRLKKGGIYKKIIVRSIISTNKLGNYTGFHLNNNYIIRFQKTKKRIIKEKEDKIIFYNIDESRKKSIIKELNKESRKYKELYYILLTHIAHYLDFVDNKDPNYKELLNISGKKEIIQVKWEKKLLDIYGSKENTYFIRDYHNMIIGRPDLMEYFKKDKIKIIRAGNNDKEIDKILRNMMDRRIKFIDKKEEDSRELTENKYRRLCTTSGKFSVTKQCSEREKLKIRKPIYNQLMTIVTRELIFNKMRRLELLENKVSYIMKYREYTKDPDVIIEKIYLMEDINE